MPQCTLAGVESVKMVSTTTWTMQRLVQRCELSVLGGGTGVGAGRHHHPSASDIPVPDARPSGSSPGRQNTQHFEDTHSSEERV